MHSEAARPTSTSMLRTKRCPKCSTAKKSGKVSCCARGGSWFRKCGGDDSDTNFEHTWIEGIQACNGFANLPLDKALAQPGYEITISNLTNTTGRRTAVQQYADISPKGHISDVGTTNCEDGVARAQIVVFTIALLFDLCLKSG